MSVATEKSSRIMETLIVSAKPKNVLYGKVIGSGLVGLCQLCGLLLVAVGMLKFAVPESSLFNAPQLSAGQIALVIVYFILGYTLFSFIQSVSGALVSKIEDMQQAMMPAAMLVVICFYAGYFPGIMSYSTGNGGAASPFLLLLPFTAPFSVVGQILSDEPLKPSILIASLALLIAAIFIVGFICAKIYAASVLHYGARLRIKDLRKLIRNK
jgi:ABC-2 type transport system permease protein